MTSPSLDAYLRSKKRETAPQQPVEIPVAETAEEPATTQKTLPGFQTTLSGAPIFPHGAGGFGDPRDTLIGQGPLFPTQTRAQTSEDFLRGNIEGLPGPGEAGHVPPTTEDLELLDSYGMLFAPDGRNLYPLTPEFRQGMARSGQGALNALEASPFGMLFSATEEVARGARYGGEQLIRAATPGADESEVWAFRNKVAVKEHELGRPLNYWERQEIYDESFEAPKGVRGGAELAIEMALPATVIDKVIGKGVEWGIKPGWKGVKFVGNQLFSRETSSKVAGGLDDAAKIVSAPDNNHFGIPDVKVGLTRKEKILNSFADIVPGMISSKHELGLRVMDSRAAAISNAESLAASTSAELDVAVKNVFDVAPNGTVPSIPNLNTELGLPPTIADIAANYPQYSKWLNDDQKAAMELIRGKLAPVRDSLEEMGVEISERIDIVEGGFYIPRGRAFQDIEEEVVTGGVRKKGGPKSQKTAKFETESAGIEKGYEYVPFNESINSYIREAGRHVGDRHAMKIFKEAVDEDGVLLGSTYLARLSKDPVYMTAQRLTRKINNRVRKVIAANTRASERIRVSDIAEKRAQRTAQRGEAQVERVRGRSERDQGRYDKRTEHAKKKFEQYQGLYDSSDLAEARKIINESISEGRALVHRARANAEDLKRTKAKVRKSDKALTKIVDDLSERLDAADNMAQAMDMDPGDLDKAGGIEALYTKILGQSERLQDRIAIASSKHFDLEDRVDDILAQRGLIKDEDAISRAQRIRARQEERALLQAQRTEQRLKNTWRILEREQERARKLIGKTESREIKNIQKQIDAATGTANSVEESAIKALKNFYEAQDELAGLKDEYRGIHSELARARKLANETPRGMGTMDIPGLEGYSFPAVLARTVNDIIEKEMPTRGAAKQVIGAWNWHASLWRSLRATLDDSAPIIQGLLRMADHPVMAGRAMGWHIRAWGANGEQLLGSYITEFNKKAAAQGGLTTEDMSRLGLRIGGIDTEMTVGKQKYLSRLGRAPGIKQANRAYGFYGDRLRMDWMKDSVEGLMREGRTLQDIVDSGDARDLAKAINSATGYSDKRFGGVFGDMLLFAPRFFQARLETAARAGRAMATDPLGAVEAVPMVGRKARQTLAEGGMARDISVKDREARRAFLRLISGGTMMTVMANEMLGNETDFNVLKKNKDGEWEYNSNFMRIRFGGRDWSLFGTWDSMLRLMIVSGMTGNPIEGLRGLASGPVSLGWDLITGETFTGERPEGPDWVPDDPEWMPGDTNLKTAAYILESHLPFAFDEVPQVGEHMQEGDMGKAAALLSGEFFGGKSSPLSRGDLLYEISKEKKEQEIKSPSATRNNPGWDPDNLSKAEKRIIDEDPRMKKYMEGMEAKIPDELDKAFDDLDRSMNLEETNLENAIVAGTQGRNLVKAISEFKRNRSEVFNHFEENNAELLAELDTPIEEMNEADRWAHKYFNVDLDIDIASGYMDFEKYEAERNQILEDARRVDPVLVDYITGKDENSFRGKRFESDRVREVIESYEADLEIMRRYFDLPMQVAKAYNLEDEYNEYLRSDNKNEYMRVGKHAKIIKALNNESNKYKEALRLQDWELEAKLYKWGMVGTPINPEVKRMRTDLILDQGQRAGGKDFVPNLNDMEAKIAEFKRMQ